MKCKKIRKYWVLYISLFAITFVIFITLTNILGFYNVLVKNNEIYSDNAISLTIANSNGKIDLKDFLEIIEENNNEIFISTYLSTGIHNKYNIYGLYKGSKCRIKFPLVYGDDISSKEYSNGDRVALIKDNILSRMESNNELEKVNNETYFEYCGEQYKIVGVIDSKKGEGLRDIYININSILENKNISLLLDNYLFVYDSGSSTRDEIKKISNKYVDIQFNIENLKVGKEALNSSIDANRIYVIGSLLLIVVCILTIINITNYWFNSEKKGFGIRKLIGVTNSKLILILVNIYIKIAFSAMGLAFLIFECLKELGLLNNLISINSTVYIDLLVFIILIFIIAIIVLIVLVNPILKICKLQINTIIRGNE